MPVSWSLHQAALLHNFFHESVNFITDLRGLQHGIFSGGPPLDFSMFEVRTVLAFLARRLVELFLDVGIRFGFGSASGPVIANGFRQGGEARRRKGIFLLLI